MYEGSRSCEIVPVSVMYQSVYDPGVPGQIPPVGTPVTVKVWVPGATVIGCAYTPPPLYAVEYVAACVAVDKHRKNANAETILFIA
jgi:hypothetical protein